MNVRCFFFAPTGLRPLAAVRIALCSVLLCDALIHVPYVLELYSSFGLPFALFEETPFVLPVPEPLTAIIAHGLLLFLLATSLLGWQTRLSLWGAWGLSLWLGTVDFPGSFAKFSVISLHLLALLGCSGCGRIWSLDAIFCRASDPPLCPVAPIWPQRLMQILLCSVYFGAAITKFRSAEFASGDLLMFSLLDDRWGASGAALWLATQPELMILLSMATLLLEFSFPLLIWNRKLRRPMLLLAAGFHLSTHFAMHIQIFAPVMLAALLVFVNESDLRWWPLNCPGALLPESHTKPAWRSQLVSTLCFLVLGATTVGISSAIQWHNDWYGYFGKKIDVALPELSKTEFEIRQLEQRMPEEDYIHRIRLGSRVNGSRVFGESEQFQRGMTVQVLIQLVSPHPAMRFEGLLLAPEGTEVGRFEQKLESAYTYLVRGFHLSEDLPAGRYRVLIQAEGYEVGQQEFELVETSPQQ